LLILSEQDIRRALPLDRAIASQKQAYVAAATPDASMGAGVAHAGTSAEQLVFALTGGIHGQTGITCKFGMQVPSNHRRGLPSVHAFVTLLDPETGVPLACLNGTTITTMRTACGIAAAADLLAPPAAARLAVIGSGVQAREAVRAIAAIRPLSVVRLWSRDPANCRSAVAALQTQVDAAFEIAPTTEAAVAGSDIVATCTLSHDPVIRGEWVGDGATVLTVGSYHPAARETDLALTRRAARTFTDDVAKALGNGGAILEAVSAGALAAGDLVAIGEVAQGRHPGRASAGDILLFHSMGLGIQDAAAAWAAYQGALEAGIGTTVAF
jgi:ornithine cyclodeaminase